MPQEDFLLRPLYIMLGELISKFSAIKVEHIINLEDLIKQLL